MTAPDRILIRGLEDEAPNPVLQRLAAVGQVAYLVQTGTYDEHTSIAVFTDPEEARAYATELRDLIRVAALQRMGAEAEQDDHWAGVTAIPWNAPREALPGGWVATVALDGTVRRTRPLTTSWELARGLEPYESDSCPKPEWAFTVHMDEYRLAKYEGCSREEVEVIGERLYGQPWDEARYEQDRLERERRYAERRDRGRFFTAAGLTEQEAIEAAQRAAAQAREA